MAINYTQNYKHSHNTLCPF